MLFQILAAVSTVVLGSLMILWFLAQSIEPRSQHLSLGSGFHVSASGSMAKPRLDFFNDTVYGPYRGGIISVSGSGGGGGGPDTTYYFGDVAGIYYRYFYWRTGAVWWTLSVSMFYPIVIACVVPVAWMIRRVGKRRTGFPVEVNVPTQES